MMRRGVKVRLAAFVVLSAVGITYITATYLGLVDRITGSGHTVTATLPGSGGLFEGSEVTYRGVKIGKVDKMTPTIDGVEIEMTIKEEVELPTDSAIYVHNLSAVGEQYLDFQPEDEDGPYAKDGTVFEGDESSLPVDEADLLVDLDDFVGSVDKGSLRVVVEELGTVRRHRPRAAGAARQRLGVRQRSLGAHRRDRGAAAQRAHRPAARSRGRRRTSAPSPATSRRSRRHCAGATRT